MPDFVALLHAIAKRPAMYVLPCNLRSVGNYVSGYDHALGDVGHVETPLAGWMRWVECRFLIAHPAWHWTRILLHVYGSDRAAIEALPLLYEEFVAQRSEIGVEGIEAEHDRRLIAEHGRVWYEPDATGTTHDT